MSGWKQQLLFKTRGSKIHLITKQPTQLQNFDKALKNKIQQSIRAYL